MSFLNRHTMLEPRLQTTSHPAMAQLLGTFWSLLLMGFLTGLVFVLFWTISTRETKMRARAPLIVVASIYILNMISFIASVKVAARAFGSYPSGPNQYYHDYSTANLDNVWGTVKDTCLTSGSFLADGLLIWRAYVVWRRDKRVLYVSFPIFFTSIAAGTVMFVVDVLVTAKGAKSSWSARYKIASELFLLSTLVVNIITTGCICWRSLRVYHSRKDLVVYRQVQKVALAVVETGVLYLLQILTFLILLFAEQASPNPGLTTARIIVSYANVRVVGIVPTLLVLFQSLGYTSEGSDGTTVRSMSESRRGDVEIHLQSHVTRHIDGKYESPLTVNSDIKSPSLNSDMDEGRL